MSKFKVGDEVEVVVTDSYFKKLGHRSIIEFAGSDDEVTVKMKNEDGHLLWINEDLLKLVTKSRQQKHHTETDRRKAAKAVRELEKKLNAAVKKASETGIIVMANGGNTWDSFSISMTYQPETPKMRKY